MAMVAPVRGFRPVRGARSRAVKVPNPAMVTVCPAARASAMVPSTVRSADAACEPESDVRAATAEASCVRFSVPRAMEPGEVTLDVARAQLALPREVGLHPGTGAPILAGIGRFGPWVRHGETYASLGEDDDVLTVGLNRAVALLAEKEVRQSRSRGPKRVLRELGAHPGDGAPVWLKTGHYGPFVAHRHRYASLPREIAPEALPLEQALGLLVRAHGAGPKRGGR